MDERYGKRLYLHMNWNDDTNDDYIQGCSVEGSSGKVWQPVGEGSS